MSFQTAWRSFFCGMHKFCIISELVFSKQALIDMRGKYSFNRAQLLHVPQVRDWVGGHNELHYTIMTYDCTFNIQHKDSGICFKKKKITCPFTVFVWLFSLMATWEQQLTKRAPVQLQLLEKSKVLLNAMCIWLISWQLIFLHPSFMERQQLIHALSVHYFRAHHVKVFHQPPYPYFYGS